MTSSIERHVRTRDLRPPTPHPPLPFLDVLHKTWSDYFFRPRLITGPVRAVQSKRCAGDRTPPRHNHSAPGYHVGVWALAWAVLAVGSSRGTSPPSPRCPTMTTTTRHPSRPAIAYLWGLFCSQSSGLGRRNGRRLGMFLFAPSPSLVLPNAFLRPFSPTRSIVGQNRRVSSASVHPGNHRHASDLERGFVPFAHLLT